MRFRELLDKARGLWAEYDPKPDTSDRMVMGVDSGWNVRLYEGFYVYALRAAAVDERQRVHEPVVEFDRIGGGHSDLTPENYMKYQGEIAEHPSGTLKEGWWLIVEEPEAHVHPEGQATIARYFAKLARLGVNVMATTHSDIIALKLAQMVGLADLSPEERERLGYRGDEYLTKEELALYSFEPTEDGSIARKIEVSETDEVSELPTYSNVLEEMYREAVRLLELHGKIPKVDEEP
jgi:predicted ATPase